MKRFITSAIASICWLLSLQQHAYAQAKPAAQRRTAYQCAVRAVAAIPANFPAFVALVHPEKGLTIFEATKEFSHKGAFSIAELKAAASPHPKKYKLLSLWDSDEKPAFIGIKDYLRDIIRKEHFDTTKDIRRNFGGEVTYILTQHTLNQTLISFHIKFIVGNMDWSYLIVRTEEWEDQYWVVGLEYIYWTP